MLCMMISLQIDMMINHFPPSLRFLPLKHRRNFLRSPPFRLHHKNHIEHEEERTQPSKEPKHHIGVVVIDLDDDGWDEDGDGAAAPGEDGGEGGRLGWEDLGEI